jgi:prepilin-type N-terminal cleavage/methylation domain-containing protein
MVSDRSIARAQIRGFTMIEIMVVMAIMAVVLTTGIPLIYNSLRKDPMQEAASAILEACRSARTMAIMQGTPAELIIGPKEHTLSVSPSVTGEPGVHPGPPADIAAPEPPAPSKIVKPFQATISPDVEIGAVYVNLLDFTEADQARVRFFPNGTSDELAVAMHWNGKVWKISLEILTSIASVEVVR